MNKNTLMTILYLGRKNIKRWWGRLSVIAILLMLTTTLSIFYNSMLTSEQTEVSSEIERLNLPYDLLVKLPNGIFPLKLDLLPKPLNSTLIQKT